MIYNILWVDDEHEALSGFKGRARRHDINLIPFKSLEGGMGELKRNYPQYDGILLDAKFFENEDDEAGTEDTQASIRAKDQVLQLPKKFEIFVLTGQAEAFESVMYKKVFPNVYKKGIDSEIERLFTELKQAADRQVDTQLRHEYQRAFDVCTERYIGELAGQDILNLLRVGESLDIGTDFNAIRKIIEDLFIAFAKYDLLPTEFVTPHVALNESSKFLSGKKFSGEFFIERGYKHHESTHLPHHIAESIRSILYLTQPGSHRSEVDMHVKSLRTCYLFKSLLYQTLDLLIWFKMYVDSNPETENWEMVEGENGTNTDTRVIGYDGFVSGKVVNKNPQKGYAFFKPESGERDSIIPPNLVSNYSLENEMHISVETEEYTHNRTGETMTRVKKIEVQ